MNDDIEIEGVKVSADGLFRIVQNIFNPIPNTWYKFTRTTNEFGVSQIHVERKVEER